MMNRDEVTAELQRAAAAREAWKTAHARFKSDYEVMLERLFNEAALNRMSANEIAAALGMRVTHTRTLMRRIGLHFTDMSATRLEKKAAENLAANAALLGVEPRDMDLMSPLAYLPMGKELRKSIEDAAEMNPNEVAVKPFVSGNDEAADAEHEFDGADQLAAKLSDAGLTEGDARRWVNEVITRGELA